VFSFDNAVIKSFSSDVRRLDLNHTHSSFRRHDFWTSVVSGKSATIFLPLNLPNASRFSQFFQRWT